MPCAGSLGCSSTPAGQGWSSVLQNGTIMGAQMAVRAISGQDLGSAVPACTLSTEGVSLGVWAGCIGRISCGSLLQGLPDSSSE
eukprot:1160137-Pelagomonas_calceolata.AAC.11